MEEIGARLRRAREARGITLEQAEEETRIRRKYLEALETGDKAELPGEVYLKGFLRTYGNYLSLDGPALVEEYKLAKEGRRPPQQTTAAENAARRAAVEPAPHLTQADDLSAAPPPEIVVAQRAARARARQAARSGGAPAFQARRLIAAAVALAALAGIGYVGWLIALQFGGKAAEPVQAPPAVVTEPPPKAAEPAPPAPPPKLPDPPKVTMTKGEGNQYLFVVPAGEIAVKVEFDPNERLWMEVRNQDEKVLFSDIVRGDLPEFKGAGLKFQMGHMNGVNLVVNGQRFEKPLQSGPYLLLFKAQPQ